VWSSIIQKSCRISLFFSAASLSGAFSGLLAFGIMKMNGIGHKQGWEWIFILEGLFTVVFGITSYLLLPRSPEHAGFLNEREKAYIAARLKEDGSTSKDETADTFSWQEVGKAFTLPHVWILAIVFFFTGRYFSWLSAVFLLFFFLAYFRNHALCTRLVKLFNFRFWTGDLTFSIKLHAFDRPRSGLHCSTCTTPDRPSFCRRFRP
jgi:MFS family permease